MIPSYGFGIFLWGIVWLVMVAGGSIIILARRRVQKGEKVPWEEQPTFIVTLLALIFFTLPSIGLGGCANVYIDSANVMHDGKVVVVDEVYIPEMQPVNVDLGPWGSLTVVCSQIVAQPGNELAGKYQLSDNQLSWTDYWFRFPVTYREVLQSRRRDLQIMDQERVEFIADLERIIGEYIDSSPNPRLLNSQSAEEYTKQKLWEKGWVVPNITITAYSKNWL